jgi:membrane-associated protein
MTGLIDAVLDQLGQLPLWAVLIAVCVVMALETTMLVGIVVPGDLVVLFAAAAASSPTELGLLVVAVTLGSLLGETIGYGLGRRWGERVQRSRAGRRLGDERWARAADYLQRRGGRAVFVARYLAAVHALTPIVAGTVGMRYRRFIGWCAAGGITWSTLYVGLGAAAGASYREYADWLGTATYVAIGGLVGAAAFVSLASLRNRGRLRAWRVRLPVPGNEAVLIGALGGLVALGVATADEAGARAPGPLAYAIGAFGVAALLARRRYPVGVLTATTVACFAYHLLDYPGGPPILVVVVAVHAAAAAGRLHLALAAGGLLTGAGVVYRWLVEGDNVYGLETALMAGLLVAAALVGDGVRPSQPAGGHHPEPAEPPGFERHARAGRLSLASTVSTVSTASTAHAEAPGCVDDRRSRPASLAGS